MGPLRSPGVANLILAHDDASENLGSHHSPIRGFLLLLFLGFLASTKAAAVGS